MTEVEAPSVGRRLLCGLYDGLLLVALLLVATFPFVVLTQKLEPDLARHLLQAYLFLVAGCYFTLFWRKGQTLAMKTWRLRMETTTGEQPGWGRLWLRYGLAWANLAVLGLGWWATWFRSDHQFLQDRLAGTRLVSAR
ncbi:MAG: RDD family protein [Thiobacillus sp.]|nr:RDD family protein [Thiobacillus sp.]